MSGGIVDNGGVRSSDGIDGWVGILFGGREEEGVSVAADDDVQVRDGCRDLFVLLVAGVSQGHDDVHPLVMEAGNLRLEGLVVKLNTGSTLILTVGSTAVRTFQLFPVQQRYIPLPFQEPSSSNRISILLVINILY